MRAQEKEKTVAKISELEYKTMESKLVTVNEEFSRLSFDLRASRDENDVLNKKSKELQSKLSSLEKSSAQKKNLVDEWKVKYRDAQSSLENECSAHELLKEKHKLLVDREQKQKSHLEKLKEKMSAASLERVNLQDLVVSLKNELAEKTLQLKQSNAIYGSVEKTISDIEENHSKHISALQDQYQMSRKNMEKKDLVKMKRIEEIKNAVKV